jgi:hypothetical protein
MVDLIILGFLILAFYRGWRQGLIKILIGPLSLIIAWVGSIIYYNQTHLFLRSLIFSILGPFIIQIVVSTFYKVIASPTPNQNQQTTGIGNILGAIISLIWSSCWLIMSVILIALTPSFIPGISNIQEKLVSSTTYSTIDLLSGHRLSVLKTNMTLLRDNPSEIKQIKESKAYEDILSDPKVQDLFKDEETRRQVQERDISKLMANPKIYSLLKDPELIKKFMLFQKEMSEKNAVTKEEKPEDSPKAITIEK